MKRCLVLFICILASVFLINGVSRADYSVDWHATDTYSGNYWEWPQIGTDDPYPQWFKFPNVADNNPGLFPHENYSQVYNARGLSHLRVPNFTEEIESSHKPQPF